MRDVGAARLAEWRACVGIDATTSSPTAKRPPRSAEPTAAQTEPNLGAADVTDIDERPTNLDQRPAAAEFDDIAADTSLDHIEELTGPFAAVAPQLPPDLMTAVSAQPEMPHRAAVEPSELVAEADATDTGQAFAPLQDRMDAQPAWGSQDMEAAFDTASWQGDDVETAASTPRPTDLSDTIDEPSAQGMLHAGELASMSLEIVQSDRVDPVRPAFDASPTRPSLIAEPKPLVSPARQADIATHVVRERIAPNPVPKVAVIDPGRYEDRPEARTPIQRPVVPTSAPMGQPRISVSEVREPSLVVPVHGDPVAVERRQAPWLLIVGGVTTAALVIALVVTIGRLAFTSTVILPAPVTEPERAEPVTAPSQP